MKIPFTKMHGCGNDFIIIDNRNQIISENNISTFVHKVCKRKFHIGANGCMLVENSEKANFKMRYFNADGSEGEMCGNGARCIAKYCYDNEIAPPSLTFETLDGIYSAKLGKDGQVQINFPPIDYKDIHLNLKLKNGQHAQTYHYVWAGVPHIVMFGKQIFSISDKNFAEWAIQIKENEAFQKDGTNVNLIEIQNPSTLHIRTYERGVEEETLACGTGATASAIIATLLHKTDTPVHMNTRGGTLIIDFKQRNSMICKIKLIGNAVTVFTGYVEMEVD